MLPPTYYDNVNHDLLKLIPANAGLVVEVGCGCGALGAAYKAANPASCYVGIERELGPAASARQHLDQVIIGDVEELASVDLGLADVIVYGDVLEHLVDPWAVVKRHAAWLRPGGLMLACIPNVQYYTVILSLLCGRWHYADSGLLDRTHLRFFTFEGVQALFNDAGLRVTNVWPRTSVGDPETFAEYQRVMEPVMQELGIDAQMAAMQTGAVQYIVRSVKYGK